MPVADWILLRSDARAKGQLALNPVQLLNIGAVSSTLTQIFDVWELCNSLNASPKIKKSPRKGSPSR
jgi:hypothetical protein